MHYKFAHASRKRGRTYISKEQINTDKEMELKEYKTPEMEVIEIQSKDSLMIIAGSAPGKSEDPYEDEE